VPIDEFVKAGDSARERTSRQHEILRLPTAIVIDRIPTPGFLQRQRCESEIPYVKKVGVSYFPIFNRQAVTASSREEATGDSLGREPQD
jgi:hypothetical protein